MPIYIHVRTGRQAARDGKAFPGFLAGGDPARGSIGGVLPEFLQHAQPACLPVREIALRHASCYPP